jgi:hypothetical protein
MQTGEVMLAVHIDCRGYVISDSTVLDQEALAIVTRASPLPPPPSEVAGDEIELTADIPFCGSRFRQHMSEASQPLAPLAASRYSASIVNLAVPLA